jgi:transcription elongation GreA/GreB family factor
VPTLLTRLHYLKTKLGLGRLSKSKIPGATRKIYTLVGAGDEDYETGKILSSSPFGLALTGKKVGEIVEIQAPRGTLKYEILSIEFEG